MRRLLFGFVFLAGAAALAAQEPHHHEGGAHPHGKLGTVIFPNSGAAAAQMPFLHGTALLHSFEYEMAREAFGEAQAADQGFALAYWMEALANRSTLWGIERLDSARAILGRLGATREARLAKAKTPRERAYGAAVEALFAEAPEIERVRAFADSMRAVVTKYPDDMEAHAFTSLALLSVSVLTADSLEKPVVEEAIEHARLVYAKNTDHPGALHYLIHSYDHPERAPQGLEVARAYAKTAPSSEHALHMPSHIFVQVGLWDDVVASNEAAWAASRAEVMRRKASPSENDFHSLAWLQYAYLQQGRNADARALIDTARTVLSGIDMTSADYIDARYVVSDLEFAYANETGDWSSAPTGMAAQGAIGASPRAQNFAARDRYARAYSAVMRGDTTTALAIMPQLRGRFQLQVRAMLAQARNNPGQQILLLEQAVAIEDTQTPFGPSFGPPSLELLGDALSKAGRAAEAKAMYERSLERRPNRRIALEGLKRAQGTSGGAQGKRIANENYGYALEIPATWSAKREKMTDPLPDINDFKAGKAELKGSIDTGAGEPADWNALQLNGVQEVRADGTLALPQITVYAHPRAARTFEEWKQDITEWLGMFRLETVGVKQWQTASGDAAFDYAYRMGPMPVRLVMVYKNGVRYGFMYTARQQASFDEHAPAFERLVSTLQLSAPKAPAAVK